MFTKWFAFFCYLCLALGISVVNLIFGWGLEPKSWPIIIGLGVFANLFVHLIGTSIAKEIRGE